MLWSSLLAQRRINVTYVLIKGKKFWTPYASRNLLVYFIHSNFTVPSAHRMINLLCKQWGMLPSVWKHLARLPPETSIKIPLRLSCNISISSNDKSRQYKNHRCIICIRKCVFTAWMQAYASMSINIYSSLNGSVKALLGYGKQCSQYMLKWCLSDL